MALEEKPKIWSAYCANCECVTDMEKTGNPTEGFCQECLTTQILTDNPKVLARMKVLSRESENHFANHLRAVAEIERLRATLNPIEVTARPKWQKLTVDMLCRDCERHTKWAFAGIPKCHPACKPRAGKLRAEDVPEVIAMLREYLSGTNDDDDYEVMKFKSPAP